MTTHFSHGFKKNFLHYWRKDTSRLPFVKFLQQLNDYSKNDLVLKLVDDFLASLYALLITKSSHFVWSITSPNLNQFQ